MNSILRFFQRKQCLEGKATDCQLARSRRKQYHGKACGSPDGADCQLCSSGAGYKPNVVVIRATHKDSASWGGGGRVGGRGWEVAEHGKLALSHFL